MCYGSGMLETANLNPTRPVFAAWVAALALTLALSAFAQSTASRSPVRDSRQVLVVVTDRWDSTQGRLTRYERSRLTSPWRSVGPAFSVVLGKKGLAWGSGLNGSAPGDPIKHEGDQKAPAGVFPLGTAFGQSANKMPGLRMPYLFLGSNIECVDDSRSIHYNQLVSRERSGKPDWTSSEKMWTQPLYRNGVVVQYNTPNARPGAGSCIFLHIWAGPESGTAGCTAMEEPDLTTIMRWLNPKKNPVLVQLPKTEYERVKTAWRLP